jgi:nicotinamidase-related amidase
MVAKNKDLHGFAPEKSTIALLLIDVINTMEFPGSEQLIKYAIPAAKKISLLKKKAKKAKIPVIYANDNFGKWRSDFRMLVDYCLQEDCPGKQLAEILKPEKDDYFILKPKYSGFYYTALDLLLTYLEVKALIIVGFAGNLCVQFTVNDAYMRDYFIYIPADCVASNTAESNKEALQNFKELVKGDISVSGKLDFKKIVQKIRKDSK